MTTMNAETLTAGLLLDALERATPDEITTIGQMVARVTPPAPADALRVECASTFTAGAAQLTIDAAGRVSVYLGGDDRTLCPDEVLALLDLGRLLNHPQVRQALGTATERRLLAGLAALGS